MLQVLAQLSQPFHGVAVALPAGKLLAANAQLEGFWPSDAAGAPHTGTVQQLLHLTPEEFQEMVGLLQQRLIVSGKTHTYTPDTEKLVTYTCRLVDFQQEVFLCVELADKGNPTALGSKQDISYQQVFEGSTEPLFLLDASGCFIDINRSALALVQQQKDELVGQPIFNSFSLNLFERVTLRNQIKKTLQGEAQKFEWWLHGISHEDLLPVEIMLQRGEFAGQQVVYGAVKNLDDIIGTEQDVRFRNHQLEFINHLITNISTSNSQYEVLQFTLDELLEKSDMAGGCVYTCLPEGKAVFTYATGDVTDQLMPAELALAPELMAQLLTQEKPTALAQVQEKFQRELRRKLILVPVTTEQDVLALLLLWQGEQIRLSSSFAALLDFIGTTVGNYIARHQLRQQLVLSEDRYRLLYESSYDAILLFKDGLVVECNQKALEFFRCTQEELIGHSLLEFSPEIQPDGRRSETRAMLLMEKVLETGQPMTFEWQNCRKDGSLLDVELSVSRIVIQDELYIQAFKRDVTQRKQAQLAKRREEVLHESMNQFRSFLDKVNLIYFSLDIKGNIEHTNDYFLKYVEYAQEELLGKCFFEMLVPAHERAHQLEEFQKSIEIGKVSSYYERDIVTKSGQVKTLRWNAMLDYNQEGQIVGITSVGKDMTDKRIAMEALKDNKIRLQDLFDNAHDLIQNISVDNKFIFVNKAWKDRLGYTDQDIETLTLNDIVHPYYKAKFIYQLRNLYKGENVNKIETVFLTKAGKPVHLIGSINCSWQDGQPVATRAILHDITDRIKAERLQKVYYSIANLAISSKDLNALYSAIHRELSKIIETRNIYIALVDGEHKYLDFVYLVDQLIDKTSKTHLRRPFSIGLSEYIIKTGKPLYMQKQELLELAEREGLNPYGATPEVILCSPLAIGDRIIGVITLQDYQNPDAYVPTDIEILHFISNQVALAIERKRNEEQINNQNARLNAIFESGTHHMWSLNRKYELTSFNRNFAASFEERSGQTLKPYTSVQDATIVDLHDNSFEFWEDKYKQVFSSRPQHFEIYLPHSNVWREVYLSPIYLDDGSFEEVSGMALDITDKKTSQLDLAKNEEKFRHIFESFQDVYYRTSLDGNMLLVSPSIYQLLGFREEEVLGTKSSRFYVRPEQQDELRNRVLVEQSIRDFEVEMRTKDGTLKTVILDARLVYNENGEPAALEGVARDVSELKLTQIALLKSKEEAENLLKVKTQFLANMSHELRTPMNGIIGMIDLLNQINTDPEQSEYIDTLRKSSDALLAILNDILDLSKIQADKLVLHETGVDLHETLNKIYSLFVNRAQQKDLDFTYTISPDTPRHIYTDETRLLQVLSNLTSNAIKFTNAGKVSIGLDAELLEDGYYRLHVRVKDSGIGISPEDQQLLFNDFMQLDNSSTKIFGGTGLGLAISRQLTKLLGGDIGVESKGAEGSVFWFHIKVRLATCPEVAEQQQRQQQHKLEMQTLQNSPYVLLVDDNQINQKVAQKLLERLGCVTNIASNGYEAIEMATTHAYNIIFMDIQMPEMDGVTATNIIKEKLGEKCPPIVAMTAYSMKDDAEKFMSQGMDDYVSKPVKSIDLHTVIVKWEQQNWYGQQASEATDVEGEQEEEAVEGMEVIDMGVVEQLKLIGGDEFVEQLYTEFEEEAAVLLEEIKKDLESQDYKAILSTLHQLKGTGFTLGITSVAELAKQMEHDIKADHLEHVEENFSKLQSYYETYRKSYKEIILS
ncbi:PAS domain S-box protein [Pontibacter sp. E15-1]|uniref:PAS domain S-box protein n=1 Tax=Pontibacter sp. E15-1 TaxID=2919918 RepID=UPI001F4FBE05|nr:PAS domain S-box protein [Pontibacter sp. E15-1]MCJ8164665.1 PAS domain S-box protein [Pontibacter sp. E15-1]